MSDPRIALVAEGPTDTVLIEAALKAMIIVHLDADVADKKYADCGTAIAQDAHVFPLLPCACPCPPAADSVTALSAVLQGWLNLPAVGHKTLLCIPSKATDTWLAAAVLPSEHPVLSQIECNPHIENQLARLPKGQRIRKTVREYRNLASTLTAQWPNVTARCTQAALFEQNLKTITQTIPI